MPPEHFGFTHESREEYVAGNPVTVEGTKMVPVSRVQAFAGGRSGKLAGSDLGGYGGSAKAELVGTYIVEADGSEKWLPVDAKAPEGAADWQAWLAAKPELLKRIREKLGRQPEPRPGTGRP